MISGKRTYLNRGFTFIEVVMVMVVVSLLISIALPNYFSGLTRSKEVILKADLRVMRKAIDDFHTDKGQYPTYLQLLVTERYIHAIPEDPITERMDTWQLIAHPDHPNQIYDIRSGSEETASDGTLYQAW